MSENDRPVAAGRISLAVVALYWIVLFAATHTPVAHPPLVLRHADKLIHAGAYALLALLVAVAWSLRTTLAWRGMLAILALLAVYGLFDEATQPLVGRTADLLDWLADMAGALAALAVFLVAARILRRGAA